MVKRVDVRMMSTFGCEDAFVGAMVKKLERSLWVDLSVVRMFVFDCEIIFVVVMV